MLTGPTKAVRCHLSYSFACTNLLLVLPVWLCTSTLSLPFCIFMAEEREAVGGPLCVHNPSSCDAALNLCAHCCATSLPVRTCSSGHFLYIMLADGCTACAGEGAHSGYGNNKVGKYVGCTPTQASKKAPLFASQDPRATRGLWRPRLNLPQPSQNTLSPISSLSQALLRSLDEIWQIYLPPPPRSLILLCINPAYQRTIDFAMHCIHPFVDTLSAFFAS